MVTKIRTIDVVVSDLNKTLDFYVNTVSLEMIDDQSISETERWHEVAPPGAQTHLILGLCGLSSGDKTGFTGYVLHTDNIEDTCHTLKAMLVAVFPGSSTSSVNRNSLSANDKNASVRYLGRSGSRSGSRPPRW